MDKSNEFLLFNIVYVADVFLPLFAAQLCALLSQSQCCTRQLGQARDTVLCNQQSLSSVCRNILMLKRIPFFVICLWLVQIAVNIQPKIYKKHARSTNNRWHLHSAQQFTPKISWLTIWLQKKQKTICRSFKAVHNIPLPASTLSRNTRSLRWFLSVPRHTTHTSQAPSFA